MRKLEASAEGLDRLTTEMNLKVGTMKDAKMERMLAEDMDLVEAVVRPDSRMVGREIVGLRLRARYDADILAVSRQGRAFRGRMGKFRFRPGDLVTSVNGISLDSPANTMKLYNAMRSAGEVVFELEREQQPLTLSVSLEDSGQ